MQRRGFLATLTGALSFGAFERGVMVEAGVRSPLDVIGSSPVQELWLVRCTARKRLDEMLRECELDPPDPDLAAIWKSSLDVVAVLPTAEQAAQLTRQLACGYIRRYGLLSTLWLDIFWIDAPPMLQSSAALAERYDLGFVGKNKPLAKATRWLDSLLGIAELTERLHFFLRREATPEELTGVFALPDEPTVLGDSFDPSWDAPAIAHFLDFACMTFDQLKIHERLSDVDLHSLLDNVIFPPTTSEKISVRADALTGFSEQLNVAGDDNDCHKYATIAERAPGATLAADSRAELQARWAKLKLGYQDILEKELASASQAK